jgi:hypothetical protein
VLILNFKLLIIINYLIDRIKWKRRLRGHQPNQSQQKARKTRMPTLFSRMV